MQLVIHSPHGSRLNRAWGRALRKRFCVKFNFELQAAATEDAIVLSLSTSHSFDLAAVARYLHSNSVRDVLIQALLDAPMFAARWRWIAGISLALPRFWRQEDPRAPQRMRADDLMAAVFDQIACAVKACRPRGFRITRWSTRPFTIACTRRWTSRPRTAVGGSKPATRDRRDTDAVPAALGFSQRAPMPSGLMRRSRRCARPSWHGAGSMPKPRPTWPARCRRHRPRPPRPEAASADGLHDAPSALGFFTAGRSGWCRWPDSSPCAGRAPPA
jgi:hypothetical protein